MKKLAGILSGIMLITTLAVPAMAETAEENIDVHTNYVNVEINGEKYDVRNFLNDGTTYIALRDVSELLDCKVDWDDDTKTAVITTGVNSESKADSTPLEPTGEKTIAVLKDYVNVTVDDVKRNVRNFLNDGTTYISLRDISELLDCLVEWNGDTKTASVTDLHSLVVMSVNGTDVTGDIFRENYDYIETAFGAMASAEELISTSKEMLFVKEIEKQKIKEFGVDDYDTAVKRAEEAVLLLEKEYGVDAVNEYLNDYGITRNDYIRLTAENDLDIELSEYMISTFPEYKGVEDEAKAYYEQNKDAEFKTHSAQVKHILIPTTDDNGNPLSDADKKKAYETAKAIAKKATAKNFDSLIKEYNNDPGQPDEGYYVTGNGTYVPEFEDTAMSLKEGEISNPVETSYGYHIIYAKEVYEYVPYENMKQEYISDRYDEINLEFIKKWISESEIVYHDDVINRILGN